MRTFDWVLFPQLSSDPSDAVCERFETRLHTVLDPSQFGDVRITRSGPGIAVLLQVLNDALADIDIQGLIVRIWARHDVETDTSTKVEQTRAE